MPVLLDTPIARCTLLAALLTTLSGCQHAPPPGYPDRYQHALRNYPGAVPDPDAAQRFGALFAALGDAQLDRDRLRAQVARLYAPELYFSDTLTVLTSNQQVAAHFVAMHDAGVAVHVDIEDQMASGRDLYLRWRMTSAFDAFGRRQATTIGVTQLRFDATGRIVLHQDFWDPAQGFYGELPLLGGLLDWIRGRFAAEE